MIFEWICHDCELIFEKDYRIGKAPNKKKCLNCKKLIGRNYEGINISFSNDIDFRTVQERYKKHAINGYDKDAANLFLKHSINFSKARTLEQEKMYKPMTLNYEKLHKDGKVRKLSDKETANKIERAKKLTGDAYNKAKLDLKKPQKQQ